MRITLIEGIASGLSNSAVQLEVIIYLLELDVFLVIVTGRGRQLVLRPLWPYIRVLWRSTP